MRRGSRRWRPGSRLAGGVRAGVDGDLVVGQHPRVVAQLPKKCRNQISSRPCSFADAASSLSKMMRGGDVAHHDQWESALPSDCNAHPCSEAAQGVRSAAVGAGQSQHCFRDHRMIAGLLRRDASGDVERFGGFKRSVHHMR